MKRYIAALLALMLLTGLALAESGEAVNAYVARQGYKAITAKNRSRLAGCWLTEDSTGDTLQWSDTSSTYTVTTSPGRGLRELYGELIGMRAWDTCYYAIDGKVQFAYNAPDVQAEKSYKTLSNYVKYVSAYIQQTGDTPTVARSAFGRQSYIINKSTKKFHRTDCTTIKNMKSANREKYTGSRDELLRLGYEPCKHCNP